MMLRHRDLLSMVLGAMATFSVLAAQHVLRSSAPDGLRMQSWSSETMMQTMPIEDLYEAPAESLWHLHIQPPLLDALRALLGQGPVASTSELVDRVDQRLLLLWALLHGLLVAILFHWLARMTSVAWALPAAVFFALHPALFFYSSLLDTSLLTSVLVLLLVMALWRLAKDPEGSLVTLCLVFLALFLTRSMFQWPWLVVLGLSLALLKVSRRRIGLFLLITGIPMALYAIKQERLFGITTTSSMTGLNLCRSIGLEPPPDTVERSTDRGANAGTPGVLARMTKADGSINYNHARFLTLDRSRQEAYKQTLRAMPLKELIANYLHNLRIYLQPSSRFTPHVLVDRIPWRNAYDALFSGWPLLLMMLFACGSWVVRNRSLREVQVSLALMLPVLALAAISVLFERGENMRFKFFVEPVVFVFIAVQVHGTWTHRERRKGHGAATAPRV